MLERLHKILARSGVAALRPAEDMILAGRVTVNGRVVRELGARADPATDAIAVDGNVLAVPTAADPHRYLMLHKPVGVISTAFDPEGRPTVTQLVPNDVRVFPVGRLDADSEGLLLLTDDGDLAYRLTHPRFGIEKEYRVLLDKVLSIEAMRQWRSGVALPDGEQTAPAWVEVLDRAEYGDWIRIVLREGKKREIREVARSLGYDVRRLMRVREGPVTLDNLPVSAWRALSADEVEALRRYTQHVPSREADETWESAMSDQERSPRRLRIVRKPQRLEASPDATAPEQAAPPVPEQRAEVAGPNERPPRTRFDAQPPQRSDERGFQSPAPGNDRRGPDRMGNPERQGNERSMDRRPDNGPRRFDNERPPQRSFDRGPQRPSDRPNGFAPGPRTDEPRGGSGNYDRRPSPQRGDERPRSPDRGAPARGFGPARNDAPRSFGNGPRRDDGERNPNQRSDQQPRGFGGRPNELRREGGFGERRPDAGPSSRWQDENPRSASEAPSRVGSTMRDFSNRSGADRRPPRRDGGSAGRPGGYSSRPPQRNDGSAGRPGGYSSRPPQQNDRRPGGFDERSSGSPRYDTADRSPSASRDDRPGRFSERPAPARSGSSPRWGGPSRGGSSGRRFGGSSSGGAPRRHKKND